MKRNEEQSTKLFSKDETRLALSIKLHSVRHEAGVWYLQDDVISENDVCLLWQYVYPEFDTATIYRLLEHIKDGYNHGVSKEDLRRVNKEFADFEKTLETNGKLHLAEEDKSEAIYECLLGVLYNEKAEVILANHFWQLSAMKGYAGGIGRVGISRQHGYGLDMENLDQTLGMADKDKALLFLNIAKENGWYDAERRIKNLVDEEKEYHETPLKDLLERAFTGGYKEKFNLGMEFELGKRKSVPQDYREAAYWYERAAEADSLRAVRAYGFAACMYEDHLDDAENALLCYRKIYRTNMYHDTISEEELKNKIYELERKAMPDKPKLVQEIDELLKNTNPTDDELRYMVTHLGDVKSPVFNRELETALDLRRLENRINNILYEGYYQCDTFKLLDTINTIEKVQTEKRMKEEDWLKGFMPYADNLIRWAYHGDAVAENAIGLFYIDGVLLPQSFEQAEYWLRCSFMDGYLTALENLTDNTFPLQNRIEALVEFYIENARLGNEHAVKYCQSQGIHFDVPGEEYRKMVELYDPKRLVYHAATEDEISLIDDYKKAKNIMDKCFVLLILVPTATWSGIYNYVTAEEYERDSFVEKLMDTEDKDKRWEMIKDYLNGFGKECYDEYMLTGKAERMVKDIPYMPLSDAERQCTLKFGTGMGNRRSPHRRYIKDEDFGRLTEIEKAVIELMDYDHRLSQEAAQKIVSNYLNEKKLKEIREQDEPENEAEPEIDSFWMTTDFVTQCVYHKRRGFFFMKLNGIEVTPQSLRQAEADSFLNSVNLQLNPWLYKLVMMEASQVYDDMLKREIAKHIEEDA